MRLGLFFIAIAAVIAIGRLWVIGYYQWTGAKLIPEALVVAGFWLQFLLFGLGFGMWQLERKRPRQSR